MGNSFTGDINGHVLSYGPTYKQLNVLNIPVLHDMGLTGAGVVIGVLDSGYDIDGIACLENLRVAHTWNFITRSEDVTGNSHGAYILACLGGALDNEYYGVAFEATFLLTVTDDVYT